MKQLILVLLAISLYGCAANRPMAPKVSLDPERFNENLMRACVNACDNSVLYDYETDDCRCLGDER